MTSEPTLTESTMSTERLARIVAPHFVAGIVTNGHVVRAADIVKYMVGWGDQAVRDYTKRKGWKISEVGHGRR